MNQELLEKLYSEYDEEALMKFDSQFIDDQINALRAYTAYENCNELYKCRNLNELVEVYKFVRFGVGVWFVSTIYDMIDEEPASGETPIRDLCQKFNLAFGRNFFNI